MAPKTPAFAFDIDGVLVKGAKALPQAKKTIKALQKHGIPFIFLTNGGGLTEADHTAKLASRLHVPLDPRQFVQSHTPFHDLVEMYADKPILVLGGTGDQIRNVAKAYGFQKIITSADMFVEVPSLHAFAEMTGDKLKETGRHWHDIENLAGPVTGEKIAAITVWSSPRDWCLDLQIVLDLLLSSKGVIETKSPKNGNTALPNNGYLQDGQPPIYFCNPDFKWATQAKLPRLAQGGFRAALHGLWAEETGGAELPYELCGKPTEKTYDCGESTLKAWNERERGEDEASQASEIGTVYMIGDNPASDIQGANNFASPNGYKWKSVLVETGVYEKGTVPEHEPDHVAAHVKDAVAWALKDAGVTEDIFH